MHRMMFDASRGQRVPIKVWARAIGPDTVEQLQRLASQPHVVEFVAAMADAHVAENVAVGTVFATESVIVPRALGGDLGCGMSAVRLGEGGRTFDRTALARLLVRLGKVIPTGDATHHQRGVPVPDGLMSLPLSTHSLEHTRERLAPRHLGTLGGGNHFLELDRDVDGAPWLLVHTGSRGLGAAIAHHHARAADAQHDASQNTPTDRQLAGLSIDTDAGRAYWQDLAWAVAFGRANRTALLERAKEIVIDELGIDFSPSEVVDVPHNFVARETWCGRELLVHRKGAVAVPAGSLALIPGSMGTASYVVEGLGNPESFGSCSHGAGRVMTRTTARKAVSPEALARAMRGVVYPEHLGRRLVEEAPTVYRDIREVLEDQEDLVRRSVRLEPMAVLKG